MLNRLRQAADPNAAVVPRYRPLRNGVWLVSLYDAEDGQHVASKLGFLNKSEAVTYAKKYFKVEGE